MYLASRRTLRGLGPLIGGAATLFGLALIGFSRVSVLSLGIPLIVLANLGMMIQGAACNTTLQTLADDDKRGRVLSQYVMTMFAGGPFGALIAGALAGVIGAPNTVMLSGAGILVAAAVFISGLSRMREAPRRGHVDRNLPPAEPPNGTSRGRVIPPLEEME